MWVFYSAPVKVEKFMEERRRKWKKQKNHLCCRAPLLISSSISSLEGGSATSGTGFEAPLGTHDIADIIVYLQYRIQQICH